MNKNSSMGHMVKLLYEEQLNRMFQGFVTWRIDPYIRKMEKTRQKGRILPFVRGLRLSVQLIYAIRDILKGTNLTANWGHLIDSNGNFCSCECDVIIHSEGYIGRWNGSEAPIMDFKFIDQQYALAVISCKSYLRSGDIDREYCKLMRPFIKKIWLFAECCGPQSVKNIERNALKFRYEKFWHLYVWSKQTYPELNKPGWNKFVEEIKKLKT